MGAPVDAVEESLVRRWEALRPHLNERQRRLWLGSEVREPGSGGAVRVVTALGVAADTVRRGRAGLDNPDTAGPGRSRKPGGGRKRAEEHQPDPAEAPGADAHSSGVVATHHMGLARNLDRILVLDGGRVEGYGTHDELMAEGGLYPRLYRGQAEAFAPSSHAAGEEWESRRD